MDRNLILTVSYLSTLGLLLGYAISGWIGATIGVVLPSFMLVAHIMGEKAGTRLQPEYTYCTDYRGCTRRADHYGGNLEKDFFSSIYQDGPLCQKHFSMDLEKSYEWERQARALVCSFLMGGDITPIVEDGERTDTQMARMAGEW